MKHYFFLLTIITFSNVWSQDQAVKVKLKDLPIQISYYGDNGFHPGLKLGTSYRFWSQEKLKAHKLKSVEKKHGNKAKLKELNYDYNLGFYSHPNNHLGVFTNLGVSYLRIKARKGRMFGLSFEVGYLRRFNKFKTYELNGDGMIVQKKLAGNNALMLSIAPVFGKQFKISDQQVRVYTKPIIQLVSYNHSMVPNASLEIGITFNINRK